MHWIDYIIVLVSILAAIGMGVYFAHRQKDTSTYFAGGGKIPAWAVGISIFATLISSVTFLAYPGAAYAGNWILLVQGLMVPIVLVALIILAVALIIMMVISQAYIRRIVASDRGKEQLLRLISKDLASPRPGDSPIPDNATIRARCRELLGEEDGAMAGDIASYITGLADERSRRVKELGLTAREIEVIRLSAEGLSAAGIAERLHVSVYTIKNHKQNIYLKMDVRNNAEMLRLANELGIV